MLRPPLVGRLRGYNGIGADPVAGAQTGHRRSWLVRVDCWERSSVAACPEGRDVRSGLASSRMFYVRGLSHGAKLVFPRLLL
jgi:hypothetical protein